MSYNIVAKFMLQAYSQRNFFSYLNVVYCNCYRGNLFSLGLVNRTNLV